MYYSPNVSITSPPTGYTLPNRQRASSKEKKQLDSGSKPNTTLLYTDDISNDMYLPIQYSVGGQSCDSNLSGSESSELGNLESLAYVPYEVGAAVAIHSSAPKYSRTKLSKSPSFIPKRYHRGKSQLVRSISFTAKSIDQSLEDAVSFCSMLETRRKSLSVPNMIEFSKKTSGKIQSVAYEYEDDYSETDTIGYSIDTEQNTGFSWKNRLDFAVLCICQALGLSNTWRFPYFCYTNGGGSFLLAYLILMIGVAAPLFTLEFLVGEITGGQAIQALKNICPLLKGVGMAGIAATFWLTTFYSVIISWSMFYLFNSLYSTPRWLQCHKSWNTIDCYEKPVNKTVLSYGNGTLKYLGNQVITSSTVGIPTNAILNPIVNPLSNATKASEEFFSNKLLEMSKGIESLGSLRFELLAAILFAWIFLFVAVRKPNILVGHTRYALAIFPNILFLIFVVRASYLEGSQIGILYFFKPKWEGLQNIKVWLYAFAQTLHSFGLVFGYGIAVGACDNKQLNMYKSTVLAVLSNLYVQLLVSCLVFASAGHLSHKWKHPIETVLQNGPGLVFLALSELIGTMAMPTFWAIITFFIILCLAMDSQVTLIQTLLLAVKEVYNDLIKHYFHGSTLFLFFLCALSCFCSVPYLTQAGIYFFQLSEHYVSVLAVTVLALLELIVVAWIYGTGKLSENMEHIIGKKTPFYLTFTWCLLAPLTILGILIAYIGFDDSLRIKANYFYPKWAFSLGWIMLLLTLGLIPFCAISSLRKSNNDVGVMDRIRGALKASESPNATWDPNPIIVLKSPGIKNVAPTPPFPGRMDSFLDSDNETEM